MQQPRRGDTILRKNDPFEIKTLQVLKLTIGV
jgi:hypothetical protein